MKALTEEEKRAYALKVKEASEIADMTGLDMITRRNLVPHIFSLIASPLYYVRRESPEEAPDMGAVKEESQKAGGENEAKLAFIGADTKVEKKSETTTVGAEAQKDELIAKGWKQSKNQDVMYLLDFESKETKFIRLSDKVEWTTKWGDERR
jgi:hypothetical protein